MIHYWSHGPHFQFHDSIVFLTWRLAFTLPTHIMEIFNELSGDTNQAKSGWTKEQLEQYNAYLFQKFVEFDQGLLAVPSPGFSLNQPDLAKIIKDAFHHFSGDRYELHAYCIMSNHVHLLLKPLLQSTSEYHSIYNIVQSLKSFTAREINKVIGESGQFWDRYYFDRIIRDRKNYENVVRYILMNPVAAGLVSEPEEWVDSFVNPRFYEDL